MRIIALATAAVALLLTLAACNANEQPTPDGPPREVTVAEALRAEEGEYLLVTGWYLKDGATNVLCNEALAQNDTTGVPFCESKVIIGISDMDPETIEDVSRNPISMTYWTDFPVQFTGFFEDERLKWSEYVGAAE